ncbi:MAG: glycoside hydrolase family 172 protein [Planctomycetota bacterium]
MMISSLCLFLSLALPASELDDLLVLEKGINRISSYDRKEGNNDFFNIFSGQTLMLADIKGAGTIKRLYIKVESDDPTHLRSMLLRFYWDDCKSPSVDCPLGDFFALGHGRYYTVKSVPLITGNQRGMTCYFPMPFYKRAQMMLVNEGVGIENRVYYQIDYDSGAPVEGGGYFHSCYNQRVLSPGDVNYLVLHAEGKGRYVGMVLSCVMGEDGWFGEGDERIYVDDSEAPFVQGTGLDDLFGCAWGFEHGYNGPYFGTPVAGDLTAGSEFVGYRFYLRDSICFSKGIDVYLEHMGERFAGDMFMGNDLPRRDEYYSVAYWYQSRPAASFARMPLMQDRIAGDLRFRVEGELLPVGPLGADRVASKVMCGATIAEFRPESVGDTAEFTVNVVNTGWYEVSGIFIRSSRHGIYNVSIGEDLLGVGFDFYKNEGGSGRYSLQRSDPIRIGRMRLLSGLHLLRFEALEPHEDAEGMLLGIDSLVFRPIPAPHEE